VSADPSDGRQDWAGEFPLGGILREVRELVVAERLLHREARASAAC
jgi:hypothetical protein